MFLVIVTVPDAVTTSENAGEMSVCVTLGTGTALQSDIVTTLSTRNGSGKYNSLD